MLGNSIGSEADTWYSMKHTCSTVLHILFETPGENFIVTTICSSTTSDDELTMTASKKVNANVANNAEMTGQDTAKLDQPATTDALREALATEKEYDLKKWREIFDKGRYVDAKDKTKSAISSAGMTSKYEAMQTRKEPERSQAEKEAAGKIWHERFQTFRYSYTEVPASEGASERRHVPAGITSDRRVPERNSGKAREGTSDRFRLGAAVNDRKGPPERALDCFSLNDFGRMDGQIMPPSFQTSMLDEEGEDYQS